MNINAGFDTVASTLRSILRSIFYYLLSPSTLATLLTELNIAHSSNRLALPLPTWSESQQLQWLSVVIKEGLRMHPALGLNLECVVPASGLKLNDAFLPPGTIVGVNLWIMHRNSRIFGECRSLESLEVDRYRCRMCQADGSVS
jgi:cytochrome P450